MCLCVWGGVFEGGGCVGRCVLLLVVVGEGEGDGVGAPFRSVDAQSYQPDRSSLCLRCIKRVAGLCSLPARLPTLCFPTPSPLPPSTPAL